MRGLSFLIATHDVVDGAFFAGQRDAWRVRDGFDVAATFQEKLLMLLELRTVSNRVKVGCDNGFLWTSLLEYCAHIKQDVLASHWGATS